MVTTEHIEEQSVGFLSVVPHPVQSKRHCHIICRRNQTGTPGQIQGLGNLNGHISHDENCLELFGQVPEGQWSLEDMDR